MTMYPDAAQAVIDKLDELKPYIDQMTGSSPAFIKEQVERAKKYGVGIKLSPKQIDWINSLHDRFVGSASPVEEGRKSEDDEAPELEFSPR